MNFSAWAIRNPIAPILAFVMLMVLGWQSFNSLPITRFPNIDVPLVSVVITQSGAAPAEIAALSREYSDLKPVADEITAYRRALRALGLGRAFTS